MAKQRELFPYCLGIDVGVASLGLAIIKTEGYGKSLPAPPDDFIPAGIVRTYPIPEGAEERRLKRGARRNGERETRRLDRLSELLAAHGIGYRRGKIPKELLDVSPIKLRAKASREKVELAHLSRALLHMARHRGSSAFRESSIKDDNLEADGAETAAQQEDRQTAVGIKSLRSEMADKGSTTYGQYLRWREKQKKTLPTRINQEKLTDGKDGYAFYPSREILQEEFHAIWDKQAQYYPDVLTPELKQQAEDELFFQRAITSPPPGKCPYYLSEDRLPRTSRLFQIRRIYEEANNLRFSGKYGEEVDYGLEERDLIVARLLAGDNLNFTQLKETIGLKRNVKVSLENAQTRSGIQGYPFDVALGSPDVLGAMWLDADEAIQDAILNVVATDHDNKRAAGKLVEFLGGDGKAARRALEAKLPTGWGHMGATATTEILAELKKDVVPARIAEDRAGLFHRSTPDGVVCDRLPYYGEILQGHTVPPMWVSEYRLESDRPPHTDLLEEKFGRIPNPVVHLALRQIQRSVNAVIDKYGLPQQIHIELARDLKKSAEARDEIARQNEKNRKANDAVAEKLRDHGITVSRLNIQRYKLWEEQGGLCVYTGECIALSRLYNSDVDVDHILPRSKTYLDAMSNKVVCLKSANAEKGNRPPYEAFADNAKYDWAAIMRRVGKLQGNKHWQFQADAMKNFEEGSDYQARYGTDNSYIARAARQYLTSLYGEPQKVVAVSSRIVALLRGKWGLQNILGSKDSGKKSRHDHRHHFIDALVTACASRSMVQRIQREAARCEQAGLETFVETIEPPFGTPREFVAAVRTATFERVTLSRKPDHAIGGQLHQDTLMGIVSGPEKDGAYVCRVRKTLADYTTLANLNKPKIKNTLPDLPEILTAREELEALKSSVEGFSDQAVRELEGERERDIASGKKGRKVSDMAIFSRAVQLHKDAGGKSRFTLYEKNKLVNVRRAEGGNRPTGGYISGRNHRMDFYLDHKGRLRWQVISMIDANDPQFIPDAAQKGCNLLWSAHKEDVLIMDDPGDTNKRIRVVVAKFNDGSMGVIPEVDARTAKERTMWERRLTFFRSLGAQRVVTDALGEITWRFPALPRSGKSELSP
jgi:CRISPR-associated endonuclease Csn1